jgi:hypothetical protein
MYPPLGREYVDKRGFVHVKISHGNSHRHDGNKRYGNYYPKHRLVMEQHLGRQLSRSEHVHHIDGNRSNCDTSNLMVLLAKQHNKLNNFIALLNGLSRVDQEKVIKTLIYRFPDLF